MTQRSVALVVALFMLPSVLAAQERVGLGPASLVQSLAASWPTYSGDYTGRRYSRLTQITTDTVKHLTLAWTRQLDTAAIVDPAVGARRRKRDSPIVGGEGRGDFVIPPSRIKGAILQVDDVLYVTAPDHVWALDARDGEEIWHYFWKTRGGTHIGNRGAALWHHYLFFETPDNYLVSLDARTGEERWHVEIADFEQKYLGPGWCPVSIRP